MSIPESQLNTWSHQGSITQSKNTYQLIRNALEIDGTRYSNRSRSIFLQGSYGNDTNVYSESDIDIVITTDSTYYYNLDAISESERNQFQQNFSPANYSYTEFKSDVISVLRERFGDDVSIGSKAITIKANLGRRKADVIVAMEHRQYYSQQAASTLNYHKGICFFTHDSRQIVNYPRQHSENITNKNMTTQGWLKPTVRVLKNLRNRLVNNGMMPYDIAPSYFIEGMLYNVPNSEFGHNFNSTIVRCLNWLSRSNHNELVCANELFYLVREDSPNCLPSKNFEDFLSGLAIAWNTWN